MKLIVEVFTSLFFIFRYFWQLIFFPYQAMRKISQEKDENQIYLIFFLVFLYLKFAYYLKDNPYPATILFSVFLLIFFLTIGFFYFLSKFFFRKTPLRPFIFTFSYALFPILIWYGFNSWFYLLLPPPRTTSVLGMSFSLFYLTISFSLLFWKIILFYLAIRFSTGFHFFRIFYFILLYFLTFFPIFYLLSYFRLFYVPII